VDEYLSEKEQWDRIKTYLREEGPWIIAIVAVGALAYSGWRWWQGRQEQQALDAEARYEQILVAFDHGDRARALTLVEELRREHSGSPYLDQADLAAARFFVETGETDKAMERLRVVMQGTADPELATISRLRLARVQISAGKPDDALATLGTQDRGAFASRYHEVRGDAYFAKGDKAGALREYRAAQHSAASAADASDELTLKINDLAGEAGAAQPPAAATAAR